MRTNEEIVDLIIKLKDEKGLSLSELARRVGFAKSGVSRYFNKTRDFPLNKVGIFAKVLNVTPEYLLGFETAKDENISPQRRMPDVNWDPVLTLKDVRDVERDLEAMLSGDTVVMAYGGKLPEEMDDEEREDYELYIAAMRTMLLHAKRINKKRHTPLKYRVNDRD